MKSRIFMSMLVIVVAISMVVGGTMAWFNDSDKIYTNAFTAGRLDIDINGSDTVLNLGTVDKMAPGDVMAANAVINIVNKGNLDLAWFGRLGYSGDPLLKNYIYIDSMKMEFINSDGTTNWFKTDEFIKDGKGIDEYNYFKTLQDQTTGVIMLSRLMGDSVMNAFGYENMGALKPYCSYRLSFKLGLHESADYKVMGKSANLSYEVQATQIKAGALDELFVDASTRHEQWFNDQIALQH